MSDKIDFTNFVDDKEDVKFEGNKCQECLEETEEYWEAIWHNIAEAEATGN